MKNSCSPRHTPAHDPLNVRSPRTGFRRIGFGLLIALTVGATARLAADDQPSRHYQQTNLVSDVAGLAATPDSHLVNAWGLAASATGPWWVSDNGTGLVTVYNGAGAIQSLVVTVPNVPGVTEPAAPTGMVSNGVATEFLVADAKPAHFIFATEEGTISGWNSGNAAVLVVDNSKTAVYKGLARAQMKGANFLYAVNFGGGTIDVFDTAFKPVKLAADAFHDAQLPDDYAPFNVQSIGDALYVTFAKKEAGSIDELHGPGKGFVDVFSTDGVLQRRLQWGAWFNAPWGVALAPADFGRFSGMILVGQFGSGKIAAFDAEHGQFRGLVRGEHGRPLIIEGLWALAFGNGANAGPTTTLFFTAGIDDEAHGLFGTITAMPASDRDDDHDHVANNDNDNDGGDHHDDKKGGG